MTREVRHALDVILACVLLLVLLAVEARGQTRPRYYDEQLLNYRYTEFCARTKPAPPGLVESIDAAFEKDKSLAPIWIWVHEYIESRKVCRES